MPAQKGRRLVTDVAITLGLAGAILLTVEIVRWKLRPEQRRLRVIRKLGGGR